MVTRLPAVENIVKTVGHDYCLLGDDEDDGGDGGGDDDYDDDDGGGDDDDVKDNHNPITSLPVIDRPLFVSDTDRSSQNSFRRSGAVLKVLYCRTVDI